MIKGILGLLGSYYKPILFVGLLALAMLSGWKLNTYYTGYQESIEQRIEKKVDDGLSRMQQEGARQLIETQKVLKDSSDEIISKQVPLIVDRPIYLNQCLDQDGKNILEQLRENSRAKRGLAK